MISDLALACACEDIYDPTSPWANRWDIKGIVVGHRKIGADDEVVFRGSETAEDWFHDFEALPTHDPNLGHVHSGFVYGMREVLSIVLPALGESIYVTGHSLGAARAWIFGALLIAVGMRAPKAIIPFAPPKPGFEDFRGILFSSGSILRGYHNDGDPVPDVPLYLPLFEFVHPIQLTPIHEAPDADDRSPLRAHHIRLYRRALQKGAHE